MNGSRIGSVVEINVSTSDNMRFSASIESPSGMLRRYADRASGAYTRDVKRFRGGRERGAPPRAAGASPVISAFGAEDGAGLFAAGAPRSALQLVRTLH